MEVLAPMKTKKPLLTGERLVLRPLEDGDRDGLLRIVRDGRVKKTYMLPDLEDEAKGEAFFARMRDLSRSERFVWGISLQGALIGFLNECGIEGDAVEIGYFIDPAQWNRGYATEALGLAIAELFRMGYRTVRAGWFEENPASGRVMEKCGMRPTEKTSVIAYRGADHRCLYRRIDRDMPQTVTVKGDTET